MGSKRVVVTGMGAITPIGNNLNDYKNSLYKGSSGCDNIMSFDTTNFKTKFACEVKGYDPLDYFDRKESRKMDIYAQFGMIAAAEAISDASLDIDKLNLSRIGVIWGSGVGGIETFQNELINFAENNKNPRFNPFFIPKLIPDICPGLIAIKYGFRGPNFATVSACASASNAIIDSYNYILSGTSDIIITGGSESAVNETGVGGFNALNTALPVTPIRLKRIIPNFTKVVSVEGGTWLLAKTGVLDGKKATTHWEDLESFSDEFSKIDVVADRFVVESKYVTVGGASPALDFLLAFIEEKFAASWKIPSSSEASPMNTTVIFLILLSF